MRGRHPALPVELLTLAILSTLVSCGKPARIEGQVTDEAGRPISGAAVSVSGSTFSTTTNSKGRYSLDYAPGTLHIVYASPGRIPDTLGVDLAAKTYFPARLVQLISIPDSPGIYWVSPTGNIAIASSVLGESFRDTGAALMGGRRIFSFSVDEKVATTVHGTEVRFLDTTPLNSQLFRLIGTGVVGRIATGPFGMRMGSEFDQPKEQKRSPVPNVWVRTATLSPGVYAYCAVMSSQGGLYETPTSPAYVFKVEADSTK